MTTEELNISLYEKMQNEHREFVEKLKNSTPETVIECAYELVIREDILLSLEENELEPKQCKALLKEKEAADQKVKTLQQENVHENSAPIAEEQRKAQQDSLTSLVRGFM